MLESFRKYELLSENEIKIYESLITHGPQYIHQLVSDTDIKRSTLVEALGDLENMGLVEMEKRTRPLYKPSAPDKLWDLLQQKKKNLDLVENDLSFAMKDLQSAFREQNYRPEVQFFEGLDSLLEVHKQLMIHGEIVRLYSLRGTHSDIIKNNKWRKTVKKQRLRRKIKMKALLPANISSDDEETARDKEEYRESRILRSYNPSQPVEKWIVGDKVFVISFAEDELIGILTQSKRIAAMEREQFDSLWETAEVPK